MTAQNVRGTVHAAFKRTAERCAHHDFLCILPETARNFGIEAGTYSYGDSAQQIDEWSRRYQQAGLRQGHRVGLMLDNRPSLFFHWLALNALGVGVVPLNSDWLDAEVEYVIGHSEMADAVVPAESEREVRSSASRAGRDIAVTSPSLAELAPILVSSAVSFEPDERSECALLYTSGTTGRPKGCVLTNEYYLWAGMWYVGLGGACQLSDAQERLLTPLPMTHMNAMAFSTLVMILTGGCIIPLDRFHPKTWWESVVQSRATIVHYLGVMPAMLLGLDPSSAEREHRVRFGFGAGVSPRLHAP